VRSRAVEALEEMRGHVDAARQFADVNGDTERTSLAKARSWALIFLAELVASQRGEELRERFDREAD
jgi:hypothetical protein